MEEENITQPSFLIPRNLVDEYVVANNTDVYGFLESLATGVDEVSQNFLSKNGIESKEGSLLLHGSGKIIEEFEPRVSKGGPNANHEEPLVYATNDPDYSIFLAILDLNDENSGMGRTVYIDGKIVCSVSLEFVNGTGTFSDGYVYLFDASTFQEDAQHNFSSPEHQKPVLAVPVTPKDLRANIVIDPTL